MPETYEIEASGIHVHNTIMISKKNNKPKPRYRGRKSKYRKKLDTPYWKEVRQMIHKRDNHKCRKCGSTKELEVHHLKYYINGKSIIGCEKQHLECLILLCSVCHSRIHGKIR